MLFVAFKRILESVFCSKLRSSVCEAAELVNRLPKLKRRNSTAELNYGDINQIRDDCSGRKLRTSYCSNAARSLFAVNEFGNCFCLSNF